MFIAAKYQGRWAILDGKTRVWYFAAKTGKINAEKRARELNAICKNNA